MLFIYNLPVMVVNKDFQNIFRAKMAQAPKKLARTPMQISVGWQKKTKRTK